MRRILVLLSLLAAVPAASPAFAAEPDDRSPRSEQRIERYEVLPDERARIQETRSYEFLTVAALAGGAAVMVGVVTGSSVAALAVAGAVVASYVSAP
ncbi:MAG: hypothetical protein AB7G39_03850 [Alphaproteobacteria bacterium]